MTKEQSCTQYILSLSLATLLPMMRTLDFIQHSFIKSVIQLSLSLSSFISFLVTLYYFISNSSFVFHAFKLSKLTFINLDNRNKKNTVRVRARREPIILLAVFFWSSLPYAFLLNILNIHLYVNQTKKMRKKETVSKITHKYQEKRTQIMRKKTKTVIKFCI